VFLTRTPSLTKRSLPKITALTSLCAKFRAKPLTPVENSKTSPAFALSKPRTIAIPSRTLVTTPKKY
jgi:hypothetical protein